MAAKDYVIVKGFAHAFLTKKVKPRKDGRSIMSKDRRIITDSEIIALFEFYLRNFLSGNDDDTVILSDENGKEIFSATLLEK